MVAGSALFTDASGLAAADTAIHEDDDEVGCCVWCVFVCLSFFSGKRTKIPMPSPAASPFPTWLLLVLMAIGAKRQRVDRRGSEAAGDGDECNGRDGDGCPFSTADYKQRRQSNGVGNGLKRYCKRCS